VTARRRSEQQLVHLANHDPLTGLLNRRRLDEEIERLLAETQRYGVEASLLFLDLDQFKDVNDSRGHRAGDELLKGVARILRARARNMDLVARLGGDEFAILLAHIGRDEVVRFANDLLEDIRSEVFIAAAAPIRITASGGIALLEPGVSDAGELLARADLAMYKAKDEGRNRVALFHSGARWQAEIESRIGWQERVREALEKDLFELHAQPILAMKKGDAATRYELLLRMRRTNGEGVVLPTAFLEVAERSGLIQDIDRWVVRKAIDTLAAFQAAGEYVVLEVNLSGRAFGDPQLLSIIEGEIAAKNVDPSRLVLEVTETAAIANMDDARAFIATLGRIGCQFALDDFGVGFSSFSHLKHLPVQYLKIDGSFIRDLPRDTVDQHLVRAIVGVAQALGKQTIAEFVGDEATVGLLREYGVDFAQGYFIGEPAPLTLRTRQSEAA
jgi:diguanylate cyclase (GGDEF)-like protein